MDFSHNTPKNFRHDIEGLRGIAVLMVILYHANFSFWSGGFIGVDVFFVISGYLITSIIYSQAINHKFSIKDFYARRIRRIIPALFTMVIITTILAWFIFLPPEFEKYGLSVAATSGFLSNILFWRESGYFDSSAWLKPLLHTWSLSVEEQFYIFFPIFILMILKISKKYIAPIIILGIFISLGLSEYLLEMNKQAASYYTLPTRAWELLIGSVIAIGILPQVQKPLICAILSMLGLSMIVLSGIYLNPTFSFPGLNAIYPTLGAALIIYAGQGNVKNLACTILSSLPFTFLGKISYSLYLWHWPLLVFAQYYMIDDISTFIAILMLCLSVLLATLSWIFIEQPFRSTKMISSQNKLLTATIGLLLFCAVMGLSIYYLKGIPSRFNPDIIKATTATKGLPSEGESFGQGQKIVMGDTKQEQISFIVWGDSHANSMAPALDKIANMNSEKGLLLKNAGCFPSIEKTLPISKDCRNFNEKVVSLIQTEGTIKTVYIVGRWSAYPRWWQGELHLENQADALPLFEQGLQNSIEFLQKSSIRVVLFTQIPPVKDYLVPSILGRILYFNKDMDIRPSLESYYDTQKLVLPILEKVSKANNIQLIKPHHFMCNNTICEVAKDNISLYYDDDHLSTYGAIEIVPQLNQQLLGYIKK